EFYTKNNQREYLDRDSEKNRLFLENYWDAHFTISYWYGHYLYNGIGGGKDENEAINLFKKAAYKGHEAIDFCEKNNIEYPISENNYLNKFEDASKLHKSRNESNKIEVEEKNIVVYDSIQYIICNILPFKCAAYSALRDLAFPQVREVTYNKPCSNSPTIEERESNRVPISQQEIDLSNENYEIVNLVNKLIQEFKDVRTTKRLDRLWNSSINTRSKTIPRPQNCFILFRNDILAEYNNYNNKKRTGKNVPKSSKIVKE
ncbi:18939_t:CDS:2, partial [Gigaspora rosea]